MNKPPTARSLVCSVALAGCLTPLAGCGEPEPPAAPAPAAAAHRYDVAGEVLAVQEPVAGLPRLSIAHEQIPAFRDLETEEVVGMPAMTMPFPVAAGLPVPAEGERVRFTLLVDGRDHGGLPYVIESFEEPAEAP